MQNAGNDSRTEPAGREDQLDPVELALGVWRRRWLILAVSVVAAIAGWLLPLVKPPVYQAAAKVFIPPLEMAPGVALTGSAFTAIVQGQDVASVVAQELRLGQAQVPLTVDRFRKERVSVISMPDTRLSVVNVRLEDPNTAAAAANRLAELSVERVRKESHRRSPEQLEEMRTLLERSRRRLEAVESRLRSVADPSGAAEGKPKSPSPSLQELSLTVEFERARLAYVDLWSRNHYERTTEEQRLEQLRVFDRALPPTEAQGASWQRRAAAAGLGAYFAMVVGVLLFDALRAAVLTRRT